MRSFVIIGSLSMALSVALGAFGAHILKDFISSDMMAIFDTGNQYHMFHSLGLILVGLLYHQLHHRSLVQWAGWLLMIGIIIFSGSLYFLSITGIRVLGAITPFGGFAFVLGWIIVAISAIKRK